MGNTCCLNNSQHNTVTLGADLYQEPVSFLLEEKENELPT
jgi:hypothetical protein